MFTDRRSAICLGFGAGVLLAFVASPEAMAHGRGRAPLVLKDQGSFYAGGQIVTIPSRIASGTVPEPGVISVNHVYVQYQIPRDTKFKYPILMVHGGGHTGKTYETTPDGREGWYTSFARRGFGTYALDDPNRGRACCDPTKLHLVRMGLAPPSELPNMNIYTKETAYATFRFGTYPNAYPGTRFPISAMDQYAPQWVLTYRDAEENQKITDGIIAAIDKIGPVILMTHSQSGPRGLEAVFARSNKVKAYVSIEPAGFGIPAGQLPTAVKKVPMLTVFGDYVEQSTQASGWLASARDTTSQITSAGGTTKVIHLPEIGIKGNSHMMMMDNNSEKLADIIEQWLKKNVRK